MFPISNSLGTMALTGFALFASLSFACALNLRGRNWLFALPIIVAVTIFGYLCSITPWEQQYAVLLPIKSSVYFSAILISAYFWAVLADKTFQRIATGASVHFLIIAALPSLLAALYVVWDQTLPQNDCANSHLDVSVMGRSQYRVYPEVRVRLDRKNAGDTGLEFHTLYSSSPDDKRALAQLCRQDEPIETARIWITPIARADAVESACEARERAFCSEVDTAVMRQLSRVTIGRYVKSEIDYYLGWFFHGQNADILAIGDW